MHRNYHFLLSECSPARKTTMFENSDLYRMNWRKRYFDAFSCYRPGGELPYEEYTGGVPRVRVIFSRKNS